MSRNSPAVHFGKQTLIGHSEHTQVKGFAMQVKLSVPGARDKVLGTFGLVVLVPVILVVLYGVILAALWYVPEFFIWIRQLRISDDKGVGWNYGRLIMFLFPLAILVIVRGYQRIVGLWSFINFENDQDRFSFDFTHRQWWPRHR